MDQPSRRSPVPSAQSDTALSVGVGSLRGSIDSALASTARRIRPASRARPKTLPPLADTIAEKLVFPPVTQSWFLAAARGKRMNCADRKIGNLEKLSREMANARRPLAAPTVIADDQTAGNGAVGSAMNTDGSG